MRVREKVTHCNTSNTLEGISFVKRFLNDLLRDIFPLSALFLQGYSKERLCRALYFFFKSTGNGMRCEIMSHSLVSEN